MSGRYVYCHVSLHGEMEEGLSHTGEFKGSIYFNFLPSFLLSLLPFSFEILT